MPQALVRAVPVSLSLTAATVAMPFAELVDPAVYGEHRNIESDQLCLLAPGEQVCSLQYRAVKTKWLPSRLIEPLQLSKTRQWSCMEGDRRDAYEDSDEEDEDIIEVDLGDVEEFNGEWDAKDFVEGTIYLQSSPDESNLPS
ncbi:hypothetical protein EDB81DRAFT_672863 [Dactylonectria macrodidyma]|uniref:Uncharacterized protein n=1 Tax=Dactylonectria macrodidyma TaxID=307937 RepID=A0A9P9CYS8_9HYPO|nr:hypothetical protein EDB81DRAFT_672863 [Dactylonectria macrodidyma]